MALYALTIFTSAVLLFLVQPIIAKQILPWFGGSAAVWTTCMVFFQFLLLFGYAYADWTTRRLHAKRQAWVHIALLVLSLICLPIIADATWKPAGDEDPTWRILGLLTLTIGLPYFLLSTTGPLVQAWFARSFPSTSVYRLFALSNFGSLLALVAYPFAVEPWTSSSEQSWTWSAGYICFALLCTGCALYSARSPMVVEAAGVLSSPRPAEEAAPKASDYLMWLLLAGMGSFMLLAVSNHIAHDIASVPFLWILPLTLYLLTFIVCFEGRQGRGWYQRIWFLGPMMVAVAAMAWSIYHERGIVDVKEALPLFSAGLFLMCMFFHGELAAMKPSPRHLTGFYLMVSLGGALGGLAVGFVAPKVFNAYYELGLSLLLTLGLAAYLTRSAHKLVPVAALAALGVTGYYVVLHFESLSSDTRVMERNFYGTLRVKDTGPASDPDTIRRMLHGMIMHGEQHLGPRRKEPTSYYGPTAGVGQAILALQPSGPLRVGVVGLGVGTLAAYGRAGDTYRFYEINPQVVDAARKEFFFLSDSAAKIETVLGDARLAMERETPQQYDVLVIDAFSSDAIPVHLMTREAMAVYLRHIKPGGVLAIHITNRFLRLGPVVKRLADDQGLHAILIDDDAEGSDLSTTDWMLLSRDAALLKRPEMTRGQADIEELPGLRIWTDSFNNLFQILK
jgi:SAM-dependent methyltransferase